MRRGLLSFVVIAVALVLQVGVVDQLTLPAGAVPDLVLLAVVALALTGGPVPGAVTGFLAGLAVDVVPPVDHPVGEYALVFCLLGYVAGVVATRADGTIWFFALVTAAGAAAGAALEAALGGLLSDPQVSWLSVARVLPATVVYDAVLSPFVLYAVVALARAVLRRGGAAPAADTELAGAWVADAASAAGTVRQVGAGGPARLRLSRHGSQDGWIGAGRGATAAFGDAGSGSARRTGVGGAPMPKLRFGGGKSAATIGTGGSGWDGARGGAVPRFRRRRGAGAIGVGGPLTGNGVGGNVPSGRALRGDALRGQALGRRAPRARALRGQALRDGAVHGKAARSKTLRAKALHRGGLGADLGRGAAGRGIFRLSVIGRRRVVRGKAFRATAVRGGLAQGRSARGFAGGGSWRGSPAAKVRRMIGNGKRR